MLLPSFILHLYRNLSHPPLSLPLSPSPSLSLSLPPALSSSLLRLSLHPNPIPQTLKTKPRARSQGYRSLGGGLIAVRALWGCAAVGLLGTPDGWQERCLEAVWEEWREGGKGGGGGWEAAAFTSPSAKDINVSAVSSVWDVVSGQRDGNVSAVFRLYRV
jgi:hypothetical protein